MSFKSRSASNNQRARNNNLNYELHEDDIKFMLGYFNYRCAYCSTELDKDWWIDHLIPISDDSEDTINFGSVLYNILPSCQQCNVNKGTKEWQTWILNTFKNADEIIYNIEEYRITTGINEIIW